MIDEEEEIKPTDISFVHGKKSLLATIKKLDN